MSAGALKKVVAKPNQAKPSKAWGVLAPLLILAPTLALAESELGARKTALERSHYQRTSSSVEISRFLEETDEASALARKETLGSSAGGRPLDALLISEDTDFLKDDRPTPMRLTMMLIGSQHGTETSGGEALLIIARELLGRSLRAHVTNTDFILIPNANPDGRDTRKRVNANGVNLSTDFTLLTQPESLAINDALIHWQPEVMLDVHESAVLKKQSLGKEGYLTDFEAQFEIANNPNVYPPIQRMGLELLHEITSLVKARGLHAQRYIGEITSTRQPIKNGGLSLRNLRNKAGLSGAFSFLLENRLDSSEGTYPTPRNIRERVRKQLLSIKSFLEVIDRRREDIMHQARKARQAKSGRALQLYAAYTLNAEDPRLKLRLCRRDTGQPVEVWFADHRRVETRHRLELPVAYVVTAHQPKLGGLLDRHRIRYRVMSKPSTASAIAQTIKLSSPLAGNASPGEAGPKAQTIDPSVSEERKTDLELRRGDLWVELEQARGRLLPLLLDPRSSSSVFRSAEYPQLLGPGEFFIYRVTGR